MISLVLLPAACALVANARVISQAPRARICMAAGSLFKVQELAADKATAQLEKFHDRIENTLAKGPNPSEEAWQPSRVPQVKQMGKSMRGVAAMAAAVEACSTPLGANDPVGDDPEKERIARTKVISANSFTGSAAISLVSYWPDHVSIDACGLNPGSLAKAEMAEKAIMKHVTAEANEAGCVDIRLVRTTDKFFQNGGDEFYEPTGFFPDESADKPEGASALKHREGFVFTNEGLPN
jgi:hypothetical protein